MTVIDQIFHKVAEIAIPHFFITVEFSASGTEMPEHIEAFLQEKYEAILRGASGRKFIYKEGEWRLSFTFFPSDKVQMINNVQMKSKRYPVISVFIISLSTFPISSEAARIVLRVAHNRLQTSFPLLEI